MTKCFIIATILLVALVAISASNKPRPRHFMIYYYGLDSLQHFVSGEFTFWAQDGRMPTEEEVLYDLEHDWVYRKFKDTTINVNNLEIGLSFHMIPFEFKNDEDKSSWMGKKYKALYDQFYK